ncbi:MAG: ribonuclease P protein component [Bacilli bacterium]
MKKYEVVRSNILFNEIINKGEKKSNKHFIIFSLGKDTIKPCFGVAVGTKIGNAVARNKIKRQVRVMIENNKKLFQISYNYIIMVKRDYNSLNYNEMEKSFISLIEKGKK